MYYNLYVTKISEDKKKKKEIAKKSYPLSHHHCEVTNPTAPPLRV